MESRRLDISAMQPARSDRGLHFTSQLTSTQLGREALGPLDVRACTVAQTFDLATIADATLMRCLAAEAHPSNVLAQCATFRDAAALVERLVPFCAGPVHACTLPGPLSLPSGLTGTLLLTDVAALTVTQQLDLYDWMSVRRTAVQVVAVTAVPLAPLVDSGRFLQALYHRLNAIRLSAPPMQSGVARIVDRATSPARTRRRETSSGRERRPSHVLNLLDAQAASS
jgi:hypothetical protein